MASTLDEETFVIGRVWVIEAKGEQQKAKMPEVQPEGYIFREGKKTQSEERFFSVFCLSGPKKSWSEAGNVRYNNSGFECDSCVLVLCASLACCSSVRNESGGRLSLLFGWK